VICVSRTVDVRVVAPRRRKLDMARRFVALRVPCAADAMAGSR